MTSLSKDVELVCNAIVILWFDFFTYLSVLQHVESKNKAARQAEDGLQALQEQSSQLQQTLEAKVMELEASQTQHKALEDSHADLVEAHGIEVRPE